MKKTMTKNKVFSALTSTSLILAGLMAFANPAYAAVAFNTFPISYAVQTNYDYPMIDARNVTQGGSFSASQSDHNDGVSASQGDIVEFQIYYHNSGVPEDQATNVVVAAVLPGGSRSSHEVSASVRSDQTSAVYSSDSARGGNITININGGTSQTLEFISGSTRHYPNKGSLGAQIPTGGDNIVSGGVNIGTIRGCFDFSGFVSFRARVSSGTVLNQDLSITKRVLNVTRGDSSYQDSTTANPGDRVRFQVVVQTTGNSYQNNVIVRDVLPTQLTYIPGSEQVDGSAVGNENDFFGSGRNLGYLAAGTTRTIIFDANVAGAGVFSGTSTIVNTANVRSDQVSTRQDDAPVTVNTQSGTFFSLRKTAYNLSRGVDATTVTANPGDVIVYTLYYRNTGNVTNTGVVIQDDIRDVTELATVTNMGGAVSSDNIITYASVDVPPGVEISRSFQVTVRASSTFPTNTDLVMSNTYGNQVRVPVQRSSIIPPIIPPRTGAGEWLVAILAGFATFGYWIIRKSKFKFQKSNITVKF